MSNKSFSTFFAAALVTAMVLGAGLASGETSNGAIVVQPHGTMVTFAGGTAKASGVLHVRVGSAAGRLVFEKTSRNGIVDWMLDADLPNGRYYYDAWFTPAAALANHEGDRGSERPSRKTMPADSRTRYETGAFNIQSGVVQPELGRDANVRRQLSNREEPSAAEYVAGMILEFFVSPAAAGTCTDPCLVANDELTSPGPDVQLQDSSDTSVSFWLGFRADTTAGLSPGDLFYMDDAEQADGLGAFNISASAPDNSLFISATGEVGLGTANPGAKLHIIHDENGGIFFNAVGGITEEEVIMGTGLGPGADPIGEGFYIHDVNTNARILNINKNANFAFMVDAEGDTGMGTADPQAPLHVQRDTGAQVLVENTSSTTAIREMFRLSNNGGPFFIFADTNLQESFSFAMAANGDFIISQQQAPGIELRLDSAGNLFVSGSVNGSSSRAVKDNIVPVDATTVLAKLDTLSVSEWSYEENLGARHIGPMAEDFYATFGLGINNKHIAPADMAGVALAAVKALQAENANLKAVNQNQEARLNRLEALLSVRQ